MTSSALTQTSRIDVEAEFERHRVALTGYCYRMLGSVFDAEDAVQETLVRAWKGQAGFEGRSSARSWLFRIATNVCFDALNGRRRRAVPMELVAVHDRFGRSGKQDELMAAFGIKSPDVIAAAERALRRKKG